MPHVMLKNGGNHNTSIPGITLPVIILPSQSNKIKQKNKETITAPSAH